MFSHMNDIVTPGRTALSSKMVEALVKGNFILRGIEAAHPNENLVRQVGEIRKKLQKKSQKE